MILTNKLAADYLRTKSKYFNPHEFTCKCGCGEIRISTDLIEKLNQLRSLINTPLIVNSGYRCATHNTAQGGAPKSQHLLGTAADIRMGDKTMRGKLVELAMPLFNGVIVYSWGVHLDVRSVPYFKDHTKANSSNV